MADQALFERVRGHIGEYLETDVSHVTGESRLATAVAGIDSLKLFEMLVYLEECFGVDFDENVVEKVATLDELVDYIARLQAAKPAAAV
jgi:acyl carrier protein